MDARQIVANNRNELSVFKLPHHADLSVVVPPSVGAGASD